MVPIKRTIKTSLPLEIRVKTFITRFESNTHLEYSLVSDIGRYNQDI